MDHRHRVCVKTVEYKHNVWSKVRVTKITVGRYYIVNVICNSFQTFFFNEKCLTPCIYFVHWKYIAVKKKKKCINLYFFYNIVFRSDKRFEIVFQVHSLQYNYNSIGMYKYFIIYTILYIIHIYNDFIYLPPTPRISYFFYILYYYYCYPSNIHKYIQDDSIVFTRLIYNISRPLCRTA